MILQESVTRMHALEPSGALSPCIPSRAHPDLVKKLTESVEGRTL